LLLLGEKLPRKRQSTSKFDILEDAREHLSIDGSTSVGDHTPDTLFVLLVESAREEILHGLIESLFVDNRLARTEACKVLECVFGGHEVVADDV
jgi:hypothetical protein